MRFSTALSFALVFLPALHEVSAGPFHHHRGGQKGGNVKSSSTTAPPASNSGTPKVDAVNNNGGGNNGTNNNNGNNNNNNDNPQTSLQLDPRVIGPGFAQNGQNPPVAGQVASLTTTNNFINYCLLFPNLPITNGQQIQSGSCNPIPMGQIPSSDNMPSAKFVFPQNGGQVPANQNFTVQLAISNLGTGNFVNADANYFAAPQQLANGIIQGHSHITVEKLSALDQTTTTNPKVFAFFKGLNDVAVNGILSTVVTNGLPAGAYRVCSINTASNHQPVLTPIAQRGALDDCSYFEAVDGGDNNGGDNNGGNNNGGDNNGGDNNGDNGGSNTSTTSSPASSMSPANGGGNGKNGRNGRHGHGGNNNQ